LKNLTDRLLAAEFRVAFGLSTISETGYVRMSPEHRTFSKIEDNPSSRKTKGDLRRRFVETEAVYRSIEFYDDLNKLTINFVPFGGTTVPRFGEVVYLSGQGTKDGSGAYRVIRVEYHFLPDDTKEQRGFRAARLARILIPANSAVKDVLRVHA
jgi:hypothetical protein